METANLDGIRLDTFPYVSRAFWHDFHAALHTAFPHLTTVGEIYHRDPEVTSFFAGGFGRAGAEGHIDTGLDTPFDYPLCFALRDALTQGKPMTELTGILRQDALYPHPEQLVNDKPDYHVLRPSTEGVARSASFRCLHLRAQLDMFPLRSRSCSKFGLSSTANRARVLCDASMHG